MPIPLGYLTPAKLTNVIDRDALAPAVHHDVHQRHSVHAVPGERTRGGRQDPAGRARSAPPQAAGLAAQLPCRRYVLPVVTRVLRAAGRSLPSGALRARGRWSSRRCSRPTRSVSISILSDAGSGTDEEAEPNANGKQPTKYDTRNAPAHKALRKLAKKAGTKFTMQDRMFNGSGHIGHNKFVVHVDDAGNSRRRCSPARTNWTWSGRGRPEQQLHRASTTQIIAGAYLDYWNALHDDKQPTPKPLGAKATPGADQGDALKVCATAAPVGRQSRRTGATDRRRGSRPTCPVTRSRRPNGEAAPTPPPDIDRLFSLMRKAQQRDLLPGVHAVATAASHSIVSEAVDLGTKDTIASK